MALQRSWIKAALASLLIHGAILLLVAYAAKGHDGAETLQVSLAVEPVSYSLLGTGDGITKNSAKGTLTMERGQKAPKIGRGSINKPGEEPGKPSALSMERGPDSVPETRNESGVFTGSAETVSDGTNSLSASQWTGGEGARPGGHDVGTGGSANGQGVQAHRAGGTGGLKVGAPGGPRFVHRETPEYPLYARRRKKEGKVVLLVHITEQGRLSEVEVVESSDPVFVGPSLEAVKRSTFAPATMNGVPVSVKALLPVRFVLNEQLSFNK